MLSPTVFWRIGEDIPKPLNWTLMTLSITVPFILWWIISNSGLVQPAFLLPTPVQVGTALVRLWQDGSLLKDITASLFRVLSGFLLAAIVSNSSRNSYGCVC